MKAFFCLLLIYSSHSSAFEVGESLFFKAAPDAKIKVLPSHLVELTEEPTGIRLKALSPGPLTLEIDSVKHNIQILRRGTESYLGKMKEMAASMLGPKVRIIGGKVKIAGRFYRMSDLLKFSELSKDMGRQFDLEAELDSDVQKALHQNVKERLGAIGIKSFHMSFSPIPFVEVANTYQIRNPQKQLELLGLKVRYSDEQIAMKPLVDIRIVVAEITSSFQSDLGIEWPTQYSAEINNKFKSHESLIAALKLAEANGRGQILASPHVMARSGGEAEFLAGGELPIRIVGRYSKGIQWKRHGIFLKIKPVADLDRNISLGVEAEVSMPDSGYSVDNIPAMKTNRVSSQFDLRAGNTIVLSGLIQNLKSMNEQEVAGLAKIPIIGNFFKSKSLRNSRTELVIFVTPEIKVADSKLKPKAPNSWEGDFEYR